MHVVTNKIAEWAKGVMALVTPLATNFVYDVVDILQDETQALVSILATFVMVWLVPNRQNDTEPA